MGQLHVLPSPLDLSSNNGSHNRHTEIRFARRCPCACPLMQEALKAAILMGNPTDVVAEHVLERVPFIFGDDWKRYRWWRRELGVRLGIDPREITLTGSACVGFSLSPGKLLKPFNEASDVDVAIVSDWHFSEAWHRLRSIDPVMEQLSPTQAAALAAHQTRFVYWGCIATDRVLSLLPFAAQWLGGLTYMSGVAPTEGRKINARIYKDFRALAGYQARSVMALRAELSPAT